MQGISKSVINQLDKYGKNEYTLIVQFTIVDTTLNPEVHSRVYDYCDALSFAQNLLQTWKEYYTKSAMSKRAIVVEVWDTTKSPCNWVRTFVLDDDDILSSGKIVW